MPTAGDGSLVEATTRAAKSYVFTPYENKGKLKLKAIATESSAYSVTLNAASYGYQQKSSAISKAMYDFGISASASTVTSSGTVTIYFNIPADAWQAGQNTMTVNVALERLQPADGKLSVSNGNYVYNVQKNGENSYSFTVKPTTTTEGPCKVTLTADYFKNENNSVTITQTVPHALKITNVNSLNESWRAQARYTFSEPLQNSTHTFKCWIKSSARNQITLYVQNTGDNSQSNSHTIGNIGSDWTKVEVKVNPGDINRNSIVFNIADVAGDVYIDQVSLIRDNDKNKTELMQNNDMDYYELIDGRKVPTGWDTKTNDSNNTNPVCYVEQVEGGHE
jgi:hypothetical protein